MRKTLDRRLTEIADKDPSVYFIICDLGDFPIFKNKHPDSFINVGIQEPNAVSIAAGLALHGNKVFIYSVAGFLIHRGFEQLKFDVCYNKKAWNVKIINAGAGLCYNRCGAGHYLIDDFALMGLLPNMQVLAPCDRDEFEQILNLSWENPLPFYIRTGMDDCPRLPKRKNGYIRYHPNYKKTVVTTGFCTQLIYELCKEKDLPINIIHQPLLSEVEKSLLVGKIFVVEDHIERGGLAYYVPGKFTHIHLPMSVEGCFETQKEALAHFGFSKEELWEKLS